MICQFVEFPESDKDEMAKAENVTGAGLTQESTSSPEPSTEGNFILLNDITMEVMCVSLFLFLFCQSLDLNFNLHIILL